MILRKSQVHLPQRKIGLIEFQTLHLFCRAEMLSSLFCSKSTWILFIMGPPYYCRSLKRSFCLPKGINDWKLQVYSSQACSWTVILDGLAWSQIASCTTVLSSVHQRSISGLQITLDFAGLTLEIFSNTQRAGKELDLTMILLWFEI